MTQTEMAEAIRAILPPNAQLVSLERNDVCFGNMTAVIRQGLKKHTFVTDRGDICLGNKLLYSHTSYQTDTFSMLITAIQDKLRPN